IVVAGHKIGLAIHFHHRAHAAFTGGIQFDHGLGGLTGGCFGHFGEALLAQALQRLFDIAVRLFQRLAAIHDARAGFLAQLFDLFGANSHAYSSSSSASAASSASASSVLSSAAASSASSASASSPASSASTASSSSV